MNIVGVLQGRLAARIALAVASSCFGFFGVSMASMLMISLPLKFRRALTLFGREILEVECL